jgi:hypothetical protein
MISFVIEEVEIGVMAGLFGLDESVTNGLSLGDKIVSRKKLVSLFRQSGDLLRQ